MGFFLSSINEPAVKVESLIPDTSDLSYWKLKEENGAGKYSVYVPRDRALHKSLLRKQRGQLEAKMMRRQQLFRSFDKAATGNRATWGLNADAANKRRAA